MEVVRSLFWPSGVRQGPMKRMFRITLLEMFWIVATDHHGRKSLEMPCFGRQSLDMPNFGLESLDMPKFLSRKYGNESGTSTREDRSKTAQILLEKPFKNNRKK